MVLYLYMNDDLMVSMSLSVSMLLAISVNMTVSIILCSVDESVGI